MSDSALAVIDDAWEEAKRSPFVQRQLGTVLKRAPEISLAEAERRARVGRHLLERLDALDPSELSPDLELTLRLVRFRARTWAREAEWYWTVVDPLGIGMFGMFLPTAYCGGWLLSMIQLESAEDYARLIDQFTERTAGQAERGMRMPKVQVHQARTLLRTLKASAPGSAVERAFDRALAGLADDYLARAPDAVGLGQYAGGPAVYSELVRLHTTLDLTPAEVHARGHERIAEIEAQMRSIRDELGFTGERVDFLKQLDSDPRWRASTVEGVEAVFHRYIARMKARHDELFAFPPGADYGVAPLPPSLETSMTYGYYDPPREGHQQGRFMFNARNLTRQGLASLGSLTYHELVPGHHLHFSTQQKNASLHPFRRYSFVNAFNEGWAEYAATLAGEIGLYEEPEERYGRLLNDAFLTCRLVVDTGMNALGWSLEQAREYMRQHSGMSEAEVETDSIRYSCDIPAQALAYKLGDAHILQLRERMRAALGGRFSLKDFHSAVLSPGALPMPDLEWNVERIILGRRPHPPPAPGARA